MSFEYIQSLLQFVWRRKEGLGLKMEWTLLNKKQLGVEGNVGLLREGLKTWKSSWIQLFLSVDKLLSLR